MASLITSVSTRPPSRNAAVVDSMDEWVSLFSGLNGIALSIQTTMGQMIEYSDPTFSGFVLGMYLRNPIVFACLAVRARLFSEARFQFQQMRGGRPGALFGTADLGVLEYPEGPAGGRTTRDLLQDAILDADLGGHGFVRSSSGRMIRLRPDWTYIAYGSSARSDELGAWDPESKVIGYGYYPGGLQSGHDPIIYLPEEIGHFAPTKDPLARNRGVSLLTAGIREIHADNAATSYKLAFYQNAATPNLALRFPPAMGKEKAREWAEMFDQEHRGAANAFKTLWLGSGVEVTPVGLSFEAQQFSELQAKTETRIAALTGVHPVVAALSEGLAGSALNAGNFGSAARLVGDATLRPLWGDVAGSLQPVVPPPPGSRLWYDDRDVAFLREDVKDQASITQMQATTIGQLIKDGFTPASAIDAVTSSDMSRLVHTGLVSVQLQPPLTAPPTAPAGGSPAATFFSVPPTPRFAPKRTETSYQARRTFWPAEGPLTGYGTIEAGTAIDASDPSGAILVGTYPSLFEPVTLDLGARVRELRRGGATIPAIASTVDRTERHVRRLLAAPAEPVSAIVRR